MLTAPRRLAVAVARSARPSAHPTTRSVMAAAKGAGGAPQGGLTVQPTDYPKVRRDDTVVDTLHGVAVPDPYRWLEDPDAEETRAFVDAQNEVTARVLAQCGTRDKFKALMTRLYDYPRYSCPSKQGERYVYSHNSGLQAQSVLYTQPSPDGDPTVLLDPNTLSSDGTVALGSTSFSEDGTMMAYTLSSGGSDWRTVHVLRVDQADGTPSPLADKLDHAKFTSLAWTHDGKGFFYHRYPPPAKAADLGTEVDSNVDKEMWYHVVGRPQSEDTFVYAIPEHPTWHIGGEVTDDGRYLLISVSSGCEPTNRLFVVDIDALPRGDDGVLDLSSFDRRSPDAVPFPVVKLVDTFDAAYDYVANEGSVMTFHTNLNAPRYRLVRTDIASPSPPETWADVVAEDPADLLQWATAAKGDALVTCYLRDVHSVLQLRSLRSGALVRDIPLPGLGSVSSFKCKRKSSEAFSSYTSFTDPGSSFRIDLDSDAPPTLFRKTVLKGGYDPAADFETKQLFATSKDGTRVPMFVTAPKGVQLDGSNPCLLYGYGGFNISLEPGFSVARLVFGLGYRGVVAVANLRGGGEYGVEWRNAGSLRRKQNVFDDFAACAEHLIAGGWTSPSKLISQGGSNGGLLVAACANQRPDLFACVLAQVGVHDMLRFHKFTIGHAWCTDYGTPDDADDFAVLAAYSPVHNVRPPPAGGQYPAFMITTGDHDDRVVPLHSHKLTATLQHVMGGAASSPQRNPLITRIDVRAGHGAGKPTDKIIAEVADMFGYAAAVVGAEWKGPE